MKKVRLAAAALALGVFLGGCGSPAGGKFSPDENSIYVSKDGGVSTATVEACDPETYSQDAFLAFVEQAVAEFNAENGGAASAYNEEGQGRLPAAVQSCAIEDGTATMILDYASADDAVRFAGQTGLSVTGLSVSGASEAAGLNLAFLEAEGGGAVSGEEAAGNGGWLVQVDGPAVIQTGGKVACVTEGVALIDGYTVRTPEGSSALIFR